LGQRSYSGQRGLVIAALRLESFDLEMPHGNRILSYRRLSLEGPGLAIVNKYELFHGEVTLDY